MEGAGRGGDVEQRGLQTQVTSAAGYLCSGPQGRKEAGCEMRCDLPTPGHSALNALSVADSAEFIKLCF